MGWECHGGKCVRERNRWWQGPCCGWMPVANGPIESDTLSNCRANATFLSRD